MKRNNIRKLLCVAAIFIAAMCANMPVYSNSRSTLIFLPTGTLEGYLPNGLHYLILRNSSPVSRVEARLVLRVGSVQETEQQKGCAHFLEHVAFGGTTHFPKRSLVEYLESQGMKYGQDINAFTGFDRTIYMFAIPTDHQQEETVNRSLLIMRDWLDGISMNPEKVENEKGIILEELRGYNLGDDFYSLKIGQGVFGRCMPLGTAEDIREVTPQKLEEYYKKWYIPSLATLIIVGDVVPQEIENKIKECFSSLPKRPSDDYRTYPLEYAKGIHLSEIRDSLQTKTKMELIIPHPCVVERTLEDAVRKNTGKLLLRAISSRFNGRKLKTNVSDQWYLSDKNHLVLAVEGKNREELFNALSATVAELNHLIRNGWGEEEFKDIKDDFCREMPSGTNNLSRSSSAWCDDFVDYVISGDRYLTDSIQQAQLKVAMDKVQSNSLQALLKEWCSFYKEALLVACSSHPGLGAPLTKEEISAAWLRGEQTTCSPYIYVRSEKEEEAEIATLPCLAACPPYDADFIAHIEEYPKINVREIELKNGIRLILKSTKEADTSLFLTSFAPFGTSSLSDEEYPLLEGMAGYMDMGGIAKVEGKILSDYLSRKGISLTMAMENHWHGFIGMAPVNDATEFFNLIYEKIFDPELRRNDFEEIRQELHRDYGKETVLEKMLNRAPDRLLSARMDELMGAALPRSSRKLSLEQIERLNLDSIAAFYRKLYTRPEGTTYVICGNFHPDSIMRQFVSVFGRIPVSSYPSEYVYPSFELPTAKYIEGFPNDNETQTLFDYLFFGHFEPGLKSTLTLKLMRDVIRNRLISILREGESLVYSPYISLMYDGIPWRTFYFDINASADNRNMPGIDVLLKDILQKLQREEVDTEELQTIKRSFRIAKREALDEEASTAWRSTLVGLLKNGESLADFERYEECLESITPATLREAFGHYLDIDNYILLYLSKNKSNNDTKNN